jgi:hypothetical protein
MKKNLQFFNGWNINIHNMQTAQKLNSKRINNQINKWANELSRQFSEKAQKCSEEPICRIRLGAQGSMIS